LADSESTTANAQAAESNIEDAVWKALDMGVEADRIREVVNEAIEEAE
jgi:DNA-binding transcriptional regulator YhcF (GntR family)